MNEKTTYIESIISDRKMPIEFHDLIKEAQNKLIKEICRRIKDLENKSN